MNIGLFSETYYPEINGVATSVYMLKTELEKRGHNVYVFTTTTPGSPDYEHNVFRVPSLPCIFITERRVGLFYEPRLASTIKKLNLDIIHTHTEFSLGVFGRIMAKELKLPVVHTYHTIYEDYTHYITHNYKLIDKRAKRLARVYSKFCCNTVQRVIAPTNKTKELLETYSVHQDIEVIPTGIQLDKFSPARLEKKKIEHLKQEYKFSADDRVIVYVGRISREKNIEEILCALPEYVLKRPNVKFLVVGGGPYLDTLVQLVSERNISDHVIFAGAKPWDEIGYYYQLGDVFVSASQSETQGLTYIEAMAAGLPVVARKDECLDELVNNGENGYQFETKEELYHALDAIFYGDDMEEYKKTAMKKAMEYSTTTFADRVEALYENVCSNFVPPDVEEEEMVKRI